MASLCALLVALLSPQPAELRAQAEAAIRAGEGVRALMLLEQAYALQPDPALIANQGLVYERMGQFAKAAEAFARYLETEPPPGKRVAAEAALDRLRPELLLDSEPAGARVFFDGAVAAGRTPLKSRLVAGAHTIRLELEGYASLEEGFAVEPSTQLRLRWTLTRLPAVEPAVEPSAGFPWRPVAIGAGALALAGAGFMGYATAGALEDRDEAGSRSDFDGAQARANGYLGGGLAAATLGLSSIALALWLD